VTTGQPAGSGDPSATQPAGEEVNVTPEVIGFTFSSSSVMAGVPRIVQVTSEKFVSRIPPSREPAAPSMEPTARSRADVHAGTDAAVDEVEGDGWAEADG
jgi:hypothetical protein